MIARSLPRAATFNQAWDNLHHWRHFIKSLIEDCLCAPVPPFSAVGQPFRAPEFQPGGIVCETLVILIGCRILLAVHGKGRAGFGELLPHAPQQNCIFLTTDMGIGLLAHKASCASRLLRHGLVRHRRTKPAIKKLGRIHKDLV